MAEINDRSVSIGRVFSRAFGVMGDNPIVVFGVALVLGAGPQILYTALIGASLASRLTNPIGTVIIGGIGVVLISIIARSVATGCITRATIAYSTGNRASLGDCLGIAMTRILPVIAVSLLLGIGLMLGTILLFVPGIMLAAMWAVAVPIAVEERTGIIGAFGRSRELTRGARWKIFGLFLLVLLAWGFIGAIGATISLGAVGASYQNPSVALSAVAIIVNAIVSTLTAALWSTLQSSLFVELREWKDGPVDSKLSEIFE